VNGAAGNGASLGAACALADPESQDVSAPPQAASSTHESQRKPSRRRGLGPVIGSP